METRLCKCCGKELIIDMFRGRGFQCHLCTKEKAKIRQIKNIATCRITGMKYKKTHREENIKKQKIYRETHKEQLKIARNEYRIKYKEVILEKKRLYRKNHPEIGRVEKQRRDAKKLNLPHTLTVTQWKNIVKHFNNRCCYCGEELPLQQEHFLALSKGGEYTVNNIICACGDCNNNKNNKDFFEWYPNFKHYNKNRETKILKYLGYKNKIQQLTLAI